MLPFGLSMLDGTNGGEGRLGPGHSLFASYRIRPEHPGKIRFEGARVRLADLHGLFYHVTFLRQVLVLRVLPSLVDAEGKTATSKRFNMLPPPGIHRLHRPGAGSELLDLRDYLAGDPPKTIAWKVSARRDKLITKVYESEVPLCCTLFVDTSQSVRLGPPGGNALTNLVEIASGVAQANVAARDLTGLCLFDEHGARVLKPARTRRHLVQVYHELAEAAGGQAASGTADVETLLPLAYAFAKEVYPERLDPGVNKVPFWLPFFVRTPSHWVTRTGTGGRIYRFIVLTLAGFVYWLVALGVLDWADELYFEITPVGWREEILPPFDYMVIGHLIYVSLLFPVVILLLRDFVPLVFSPGARRMTRMRKKMSALLSRQYDLGPGGVELLMQDGKRLGHYAERFLVDHQVPHTPELFDRQGRFLFASPEKVQVLASALLRAVGKGHDNELFVLLVDLVELDPRQLEPLMTAVKVALSRHHQVIVVFPWPAGMKLPGRDGPEDRGGDRFLDLDDLRDYMKRLTARRYHRAFHRVRHDFARLHVPVMCAAAGDPIKLILDRLDRMRGIRRRR
jgi:uncharacterized protein (DUF58 family)